MFKTNPKSKERPKAEQYILLNGAYIQGEGPKVNSREAPIVLKQINGKKKSTLMRVHSAPAVPRVRTVPPRTNKINVLRPDPPSWRLFGPLLLALQAQLGIDRNSLVDNMTSKKKQEKGTICSESVHGFFPHDSPIGKN